MKRITAIPFTLLLLLVTASVFGQGPEIPNTGKLKKQDDFNATRPQVVACTVYMESNPLATNPDLYFQAADFVMFWNQEVPDLLVNMPGYAMEITEKNGVLLAAFTGGYARHIIQNPEDRHNTLACNRAALRTLLKTYETSVGQGLDKDRTLDKLLILRDENGLDQWIFDRI